FEKVLKKILPTEDGSENSASETGQELIQTVSNFVSSDLVGLLKNERGLSFPSPANFSELISMFHTREISSRSAKDILAFMVREDENPKTLMMKHNLQQKSDEADIERIANEIIEQNQKVVEEYKSGKKSSIQFLIGQGMKISNGSANPEVLKSVLIKILS
ncbi:MAG: Asp-tRNA(Asn)/Glu-tRNA(Gln) amidotransferase GatCAB subunit B, partial [Candidatus Zambryskibacteria bacterium CG11_big_fil_rev_8_21_14_0_20_40_24]